MVLPNNLSLTFIFLSTVVSKLILMCIQIAPKLIVTCFRKFNLLSMNIVRRRWQGSWFLSLIKEAPKRAASTPSNLNRVGMQKKMSFEMFIFKSNFTYMVSQTENLLHAKHSPFLLFYNSFIQVNYFLYFQRQLYLFCIYLTPSPPPKTNVFSSLR